jgi:multidrug efflux system membrane fusion protein
MRVSSFIIAIIVCLGIAGFVLQRTAIYDYVTGGPEARQEKAYNDAKAAVETAEAGKIASQDALDTAKETLLQLETDAVIQDEPVAVVEPSKAVSVLAMTSMEQDVTSGIVLRGQTSAFKSVQAKAETSGAVISQPIRKGTLVEEGELLCELEVGTKAAALAEAKARLAEAEANNNASASLVKKGIVSETQAIGRQAALEAAIAGVDRAQSDLDNTKIVAPFNGLLESDTAELGDFMQPGTPCATVLALNPIKLVGYATEQQVTLIEVGATAGARLINGDQVAGKVSFISRSADPTTRTFLVETTVPNDALKIRDGATADIYIGLAGIKGHILPQSSLTLNNEGELGVRIADGEQAKFMPISVIRDAADGIWVTGLPAKTDVIVVGQEYVTDGSDIVVSYKGDK